MPKKQTKDFSIYPDKTNTTYSLFNIRDAEKYNVALIDDREDRRGWMLKAIGKNIKDLRLKRKLTQEQVAELAGIHPKYLGEVERGRKSPTAVIVQKLSVALGVSICEILAASSCPKTCNELLTELAELFEGKKTQDQQKALKLLRVFFE